MTKELSGESLLAPLRSPPPALCVCVCVLRAPLAGNAAWDPGGGAFHKQNYDPGSSPPAARDERLATSGSRRAATSVQRAARDELLATSGDEHAASGARRANAGALRHTQEP